MAPRSLSKKSDTDPMLRFCLIAGGIIFLVSAAVCAALGLPTPAVAWLVILGVILTVGVVSDRARYKPIVDLKPGADWRETAERFVDPESGELVAVYYKPTTGERLYVRVREGPHSAGANGLR
ncbi:MAG: hypothetical protein QOK29_1184 [Rhodospirillaceae bacterium]|jgi:hypothetical protein|nr:hypothetical protein [Rhodospirillaceae bacterium]